MQPPPRAAPPRDDDSLAANSTAGDSLRSSTMGAMSISTAASQHPHLRPILVGYAFGPKKLKTMGLIMAEASRAQLSTVVTAEVPLDSITTTTTTEQGDEQSSLLTTAALARAQQSPKTTTLSVGLSMSRGPSGGFRNIVRYFRSSCSSVASDETLTTATSTNTGGITTPMAHSTAYSRSHPTTTTTTSTSRQQTRHPVRVSFVPLDLDTPLEEQHGGNFDAILHKLTEDILCLSTLNDDIPPNQLDDAQLQAISRVGRLEQYQRHHPQCSLVDHPSHVQVVMSRSEIALLLQKCLVGVTSKGGIPVTTPAFEIYHKGTLATLQPPLIAKPLTAAGTKKSHCMGIVLSQGGFSKIQETPCLLQEYVNHNAVLYKVYVMGDHVDVFERPSLPNLPSDMADGHDFVEFDSQRPYPTLEDLGLRGDEKRVKLNHDDEMEDASLEEQQVTVQEIRPVADVLKQAFGLELFGFDILVTREKRELLVVDVNYFPSYKEVSNFPSLLANYLTQRAIDGRLQNHPI